MFASIAHFRTLLSELSAIVIIDMTMMNTFVLVFALMSLTAGSKVINLRIYYDNHAASLIKVYVDQSTVESVLTEVVSITDEIMMQANIGVKVKCDIKHVEFYSRELDVIRNSHQNKPLTQEQMSTFHVLFSGEFILWSARDAWKTAPNSVCNSNEPIKTYVNVYMKRPFVLYEDLAFQLTDALLRNFIDARKCSKPLVKRVPTITAQLSDCVIEHLSSRNTDCLEQTGSGITENDCPKPVIKSNGTDGMSTGVIIGIVIGVLLFVAVIILTIRFLVRRRKKKQAVAEAASPAW